MRRLAVVMLAFIGCTTAKPAEEPAPIVVPPISAPRASVSGELTLDVPPAPSTLPLPRHPAGEQDPTPDGPVSLIGAACTNPSECGKSGKVALVAASRREFHRGPAGAAPCKLVGTTKMHTMMASSACVDGDRVYVSSTCIMCRMPSGESLVGLVSDMTREQLVRAQKLAALPEAPLLTTPAAWAGAIAAAAKSAGSGS